MPNQKRRRWTAEEKLNIIEEARQTSQTISEVCRRHGIAPGQFYGWEKQARNGALIALRAKRAGRKRANRETELETERLRSAQLQAERMLEARERAHRQRIKGLGNVLQRGVEVDGGKAGQRGSKLVHHQQGDEKDRDDEDAHERNQCQRHGHFLSASDPLSVQEVGIQRRKHDHGDQAQDKCSEVGLDHQHGQDDQDEEHKPEEDPVPPVFPSHVCFWTDLRI